jgi:type II secretory ATPase GspE/PulE/Tfp pilus assembly ATPase PilB-like protein
MRERATDIHIEAQEIHSRIRFRVDGNLREILTYSRKLHRALISRIKILCNLDIAETRIPQDGRFSLPIGNQTANFRVSTIPSAYGEKVVIRILAMSGKKSMITLEKMMMSQTILQPFRRLIQNPNGIIFVTGPTGSGRRRPSTPRSTRSTRRSSTSRPSRTRSRSSSRASPRAR